jgi:enterochelin esterase-like enzyme
MAGRLLPVLCLVAAVLGCAHQRIRLEYGRLVSPALGREMGLGVYLPPGWDGRERLPLVVFLHGGGDDERCLDKYHVTGTLDAWIRSGWVPPFIMVVPDGERGFWRNWHDGSRRYEDYVINDVIPHVRRLYPVLPGREATHLMGISMGGAGTLYMAINHPDMFASATVISAPVFDTDQVLDFLGRFLWRVLARVQRVFGPPDRELHERENVYTRVTSPADLEGLHLLVGAGTRDSGNLLETNRAFHEHLVRHGVPHRYLVYEGGHRWEDWQRVFPVALCKHLSGERGCDLPPDPFYELEEPRPEDPGPTAGSSETLRDARR